MDPWGFLIAAAGLFTVTMAALDADWFMNNYKARVFVYLFRRTGARIFYVLLGTALVVGGFLIAFGIVGHGK